MMKNLSVIMFLSSIAFAFIFISQVNSFPNPTALERKDNIDERGQYFQSDIVLPPGLEKAGIIGERYRWPNATLIYTIDADFNANEVKLILAAMDEIEEQTCIRFRERENEFAYVFISKGGAGSGCWSLLGRTGVPQQLNLEQPGCVTKGITIHELLHAIGFYHEQSREDRDDWVTINFSNVQPGTEFNFLKAIGSLTYNISYDYGSIMHYSKYAFAQDPNIPTIIPNDPDAVIGQRTALSLKDIYKINAMYCPDENLDLDFLAL